MKLLWRIFFISSYFEIFQAEPTNLLNFFHGDVPYEMTIFTDTKEPVYSKYNHFFQNLVSQVPAISINLFQNLSDRRICNVSTLQNPRQSTIYTVFINDEEIKIQDIFHTLDKLISISPASSRPKCLLVLPTSRNQLFCRNELEQILRRAWFLKFIDFTILKLDVIVQVINWNPFTDTYKVENASNVNEIFPDKLYNVNKYPLNLLVFRREPFLLAEKDNDSEIININGTEYPYIQMIANKLNFEINPTLETHEYFTLLLENALTKLEKNKASLLPMKLFMHTRLFGKKIVFGHPYGVNKLAIIVPNLTESRYNFSPNMFLPIVTFPMIIVVFSILNRALKFESKSLETIEIFRTLVGFSSKQPQKTAERIVFTTLAILSIIYTNVLLFNFISDMKLELVDKKFGTIKEILDSKIPTYTYHKSNENDPKDIQRLFSQSMTLKEDKDCAQKIAKTGNAICIVNYLAAEIYVKRYLSSKGFPIMKIAPLTMRTEPIAFAFESGSPFAERFTQIFEWIFESHIFERNQAHPEIQFDQPKTSSTTSISILNKQLVFTLIVGYSLGIVTFVVEVIRHKLRKERKISFIRRINRVR